MIRRAAFMLIALAAATPLAARESLGVYESWAAFRDPAPLRCYAIAKAQARTATPAYATVSLWPGKGVRGSVHIVLSREVVAKGSVRLAIGDKRFVLVAKGRNAWAADARGDAAIVAAIRSGTRMSVSGGGFTDRYTLAGAATAIDAATVGCAKR
jgi:hypothetical protein